MIYLVIEKREASFNGKKLNENKKTAERKHKEADMGGNYDYVNSKCCFPWSRKESELLLACVNGN